jgi:hypothetical protein
VEELLSNHQGRFNYKPLRSFTSVLFSLTAATWLASCSILPSSSLPKLIPADQDRVVFYVGTGTGSATITLPNITYIGPKNPRYLPGGYIGIDGICVGTGILSITVYPTNATDEPSCYPSGGGGSNLSGPARFLWPKKIVIKANKSTKWSVAVVDPQNSVGIATPNF